MRVMTAAFCALLVVSCASTDLQQQAPTGPQAATVIGSAADQKMFAGLWRGTLDAVDDRLDGPIEFRLEPGAVLFHNAARTPQRILWMRVSEGKAAGATEKWFDPDRKVEVYTTFEATLAEGTMHGVVRERVSGQWTDIATFTATRMGD